ncbi:hypothetical protein EBR43_10075 [bacterium]|nr:hypothetical protein [bacterium]
MNITKENLYLSKIFLELIQLHDSFKNAVQSAFPSIYADVESFKTNPNCTCRNKIESFVNSNRDSAHTFLDKWYNENENLKINLTEIISKYIVTNVAGKIYRIPRTDDAFAELQKKMVEERWAFRAFNIITEDDGLAIYFL